MAVPRFLCEQAYLLSLLQKSKKANKSVGHGALRPKKSVSEVNISQNESCEFDSDSIVYSAKESTERQKRGPWRVK